MDIHERIGEVRKMRDALNNALYALLSYAKETGDVYAAEEAVRIAGFEEFAAMEIKKFGVNYLKNNTREALSKPNTNDQEGM